MIDPLTAFAFSVYSGRGVYALLLGSGISRAAQIPTGWEVTLDLIRRSAAASGADCEPDPAAWFRQAFGVEPDYSALLEELGGTAAERVNALSSYFEATAEERAEEKKSPTAAHRAIARLAARGYFGVIITTNFDRLMEQALEAEGVNPSIISSADMAQGAAPLVHAACTLIKVHGDYRDTRIRNTVAELSAYSPELNRLLDRVFDDYGLIIAGWSATWDHALRDAMFRCPNRRYTTFWAARDKLSPDAQALAQARAAQTIPVESADTFFSALEVKINALVAYDQPHPLSTQLAIASLKRFLPDDKFRIELRDLIVHEQERQVKALSELPREARATREDISTRLLEYELRLEILTNLIATGCFFGAESQDALWRDAIVRLGTLSRFQPGVNSVFLKLSLWPACLLFYASGIAAVAAGHFHLVRLLFRTKTPAPLLYSGTDVLLYRQLYPPAVIEHDWLPRRANSLATPVSDRLAEVLREALRPLIPAQEEFDDCFRHL